VRGYTKFTVPLGAQALSFLSETPLPNRSLRIVMPDMDGLAGSVLSAGARLTAHHQITQFLEALIGGSPYVAK